MALALRSRSRGPDSTLRDLDDQLERLRGQRPALAARLDETEATKARAASRAQDARLSRLTGALEAAELAASIEAAAAAADTHAEAERLLAAVDDGISRLEARRADILDAAARARRAEGEAKYRATLERLDAALLKASELNAEAWSIARDYGLDSGNLLLWRDLTLPGQDCHAWAQGSWANPSHFMRWREDAGRQQLPAALMKPRPAPARAEAAPPTSTTVDMYGLPVAERSPRNLHGRTWGPR